MSTATPPRRVARSVGLLGGAQAIVLVLNFVTWVHIARVLAPEGFGVISFGQALLAYFALAVVLGFEVVGTREVALAPHRAGEIAGHILGIRLALCAAAGVAYAVTVALLPLPPAEKTVLVLLGVTLLVRATQLNWVFMGVERAEGQALRDVAAAALTAGGALLLVHGTGDVLAAAAVTVLPPLLANLGLYAAARRAFGDVRPRYDRTAWRALLVPALPLAASAFMMEVYYSLDKVMLEFMRTTAEVGLYGASYKLLALALQPAAVLNQAFFPWLCSVHEDPVERRARALTYARIQMVFGLPLLVAGPFVASALMGLVFGPAFIPGGFSLALLLVNAGIVYVNMALGSPIMAWGHQKTYAGAIVAGAVANVILNVVLIPPFGINGAAAATALSEAVVLVRLAMIYARIGGLAGHAAAFFRTAAAAAVGGVPAALGWALGWPLFLTLPLVALVYAGAAWATGAVDRAWVRLLVARLRQRRAPQPAEGAPDTEPEALAPPL